MEHERWQHAPLGSDCIDQQDCQTMRQQPQPSCSFTKLVWGHWTERLSISSVNIAAVSYWSHYNACMGLQVSTIDFISSTLTVTVDQSAPKQFKPSFEHFSCLYPVDDRVNSHVPSDSSHRWKKTLGILLPVISVSVSNHQSPSTPSQRSTIFIAAESLGWQIDTRSTESCQVFYLS